MNIKLAGHTQLSHRSTDAYWRTPIGYREDGRPIFPMGGGAEDDDDDDLDLDGGDSDDDGDDSDDDDRDDDLSESEQKLLGKLKPELEKMGQSIADRLVNAQNKRDRKDRGRDRDSDRRRTSSSVAERRAEEEQRRVAEDIREGRLAFKDAFGDHGIRLATPEERDAANRMGRALVESEVRRGTDPDDAGVEAARIVAETIQGIRKKAEASVLARLKKNGVDVSSLTKSSQQPTGRRGDRQAKSTVAQVKTGEERARELFPGRFPKAAGS